MPYKPSIADIAIRAIKDGMSDEEVLEDIRRSFPNTKTGLATVRWYRRKLKSRKKTRRR